MIENLLGIFRGNVTQEPDIMKKVVSRRDFMKGAAVAAASTVLVGCNEGAGASSGTEKPASSNSQTEKPANSSSSSSSSSTSNSTEGTKADENGIIWAYNSMGSMTAELTGYDARGKRPQGSVKLPSKVDGYTIVSLKDYIFKENTEITEVVIPDTMTDMGFMAFDKCTNLRKVVFGNGLTSTGECTFAECSNLKEVVWGRNIKEITWQTFWGCGFEKITLPVGITTIGGCAFAKCEKMREIVLPKIITTIAYQAFWESGLTSVRIPGSVSKLGGGFFDCDCLKTVALEEGVQEIAGRAFHDCDELETVYISKTVKKIGTGAFGSFEPSKLKKVYYSGTKADWDQIEINMDKLNGGEGNKNLLNAELIPGTPIPALT